MDVPEILDFENDMFGGDFNEKIQDMERAYSGIPDGKVSDEVNIFLTAANLFIYCSRLCLAFQWPEQ